MAKKRIGKKKRAQAEKLLDEAQELQTVIWDKLKELEDILGVEIESGDIGDQTIDSLLEWVS